jgi:hypothetical protein
MHTINTICNFPLYPSANVYYNHHENYQLTYWLANLFKHVSQLPQTHSKVNYHILKQIYST